MRGAPKRLVLILYHISTNLVKVIVTNRVIVTRHDKDFINIFSENFASGLCQSSLTVTRASQRFLRGCPVGFGVAAKHERQFAFAPSTSQALHHR